jgi:hypothetical protein
MTETPGNDPPLKKMHPVESGARVTRIFLFDSLHDALEDVAQRVMLAQVLIHGPGVFVLCDRLHLTSVQVHP